MVGRHRLGLAGSVSASALASHINNIHTPKSRQAGPPEFVFGHVYGNTEALSWDQQRQETIIPMEVPTTPAKLCQNWDC